MSKISEKIRAHAQSITRRKLTIPEWSIDCEIWPLTVEDRNTQMKVHATDPYLSFLEVMVAACRDENGRRIFDPQDKLTMRKEADPQIIERVALEILAPYLKTEDNAGESGAGSVTEEA